MNQIVFSTTTARPLGVYSWTDGFIPIRTPSGFRTEEEALRHALAIERRSSPEAALEFLDDWLLRHVH